MLRNLVATVRAWWFPHLDVLPFPWCLPPSAWPYLPERWFFRHLQF
jgi:hypothetical protein